MLYLKAVNIQKIYGDKSILDFPELSVYKGDKIGLIGLNGAGKTTLVKILYGELIPEKGMLERNCEMSYFRQFSEEAEKEEPYENTQVMKLFGELQIKEKLNQEKVSGGEDTRIRLANLFSKQKHIIFADEPTSNLDMKGIEVCKKKLMSLDTLVLISHDRDLMDSVCNRIIEIRENKLYFYTGNYSEYQKQRKIEQLSAAREYEAYKDEKERLERVFQEKMSKSEEVGKIPKKISPREARLRNFLASRPYDGKQQRIQRAAKSVESRLNHLEVKEKPVEIPRMKPDFRLTNPPQNRIVMEGNHISFSYGKNVIFKDAQFKIYNKSRTAIIGDNGCGKTTLLNMIMEEHEGIRKVPKAYPGYFYQNFENLEMEMSVLENLMKDSVQKENVARTVLANLLLSSDDMKKQVKDLSGGERVKLSFAKLFITKANILMLDEPTNYLDMPSIEAIKKMFAEYEGTLVFVSHDKSFINEIATDLLMIENKKIVAFHGNYNDYLESFKRKEKKKQSDIQIMITAKEMKLTELIGKLSTGTVNRDQVEVEYQRVCSELQKLKEEID